MPGSDDTRYAYAVARIRAVEKKLLDKSKLERMVDAASPEDALKVLLEADYGLNSSDLTDAYGYESILAEERVKVYRLLKEIAPEPEIFDLFLLLNDYHNIKAILRAELSGSGEADDSVLVEPGTLDVKKLRTMLRDRSLNDMSSTMKRAVEEALEAYNRTGDPMTMDIVLDKAGFSQMKEMALKSDNTFIKDTVSILIDLANIKIFLRAKKLKMSWDFLQKILITGGNIDVKTFIDNLEASYESIADIFRYSRYGAILENSIESLKETGSITAFEKFSDNFLISHIAKAKYVSFGIEPLVGYLLAKESELRNARIVMVGKINNIPNEIIKERLREAYV